MRRSRVGGVGGILLVAFLFAGLMSAQTLSAAPDQCNELLIDGGFESGGMAWAQSSAGGYDLISDFNPRSGQLGAYLGGVNNADDRLGQPVVLPDQADTITLGAWWSLATEEDAGVFDTLTIALLRPDGSLLADLVVVDNTAPVNAWTYEEVSLAPFAGQSVILQMTAITDGTNPTDFYLDDLSVAACVATPTPTATPAAPPARTLFLPAILAAS